MKLVWGIVFSVVAVALIGAIGYFGWQSMQEAERLAEQKNADVAQQQSEIDLRESTQRQERAALDQALKNCVAEVDQQYAASIKEAQEKKQFPTQEAADKYSKQLQDIRNANVGSCKQQYDKALEQSALRVVPN